MGAYNFYINEDYTKSYCVFESYDEESEFEYRLTKKRILSGIEEDLKEFSTKKDDLLGLSEYDDWRINRNYPRETLAICKIGKEFNKCGYKEIFIAIVLRSGHYRGWNLDIEVKEDDNVDTNNICYLKAFNSLDKQRDLIIDKVNRFFVKIAQYKLEPVGAGIYIREGQSMDDVLNGLIEF